MSIGLGLAFVIVIRLVALSTERIAFSQLGRERSVLATTAVAYGGAAAFLWVIVLIIGQSQFLWQAFWPGAIYAVSYALYTAALAAGPVSIVSTFANATTVILFLLNPRWDVASIVAIASFVMGALLFLPSSKGGRPAVIWMLLSDVALASGRLLDVHNQGLPELPYAASLFSSVMVWLSVPITLYGLWPEVISSARLRPNWAVLASVANGTAYLTVLELLGRMTATAVEAISAGAGILATMAGLIWLHEGDVRRRITAASLMTVGTIILVYNQVARIG